jgi:hypothetical protein
MKSRFLPIAGYVLLACTLFPCGVAAAETAQETSPGGPAQSPVVKAKLPYGADDVVRLSTARVNEEIILNYIQTSGTIYNLTPPDIVRLRDQGVSDRVIKAMIDQRRVVPIQAAAAQNMAQSQAAAASPAPAVANTVYVAQTPAVVVQTQPEPPKSTLHIIPYPAARAAYYGPPPHYYRPPDHGWYYRPVYPRFSAHLGWRGPGCW